MLSNTRNMFPFTVSQRNEFENQSLIFKYIMSGLAIPKDLLLYISSRREFIQKTRKDNENQLSFLYGFGCFQMGHSNKLDLEPGRCRRTDGKKWRCSKEAFPDSKYCDKHMHRGKNRSGRSVDLTANKSTGITKTITDPNLPSSSNVYPNSSLSSFLFGQPSSSSSTCLQLNSCSHSLSDTHSFRNNNSNNDYIHGEGRERVNEQALFAETLGNVRNAGASANDFALHNYSQLQTQELVPQEEVIEQDFFSLGTEFRTKVSLKRRKDDDDESQQTVYRFFEECRPLRDRDFWMDLEDKTNQAPTSATELSISTPIVSDSRSNGWGIVE